MWSSGSGGEVGAIEIRNSQDSTGAMNWLNLAPAGASSSAQLIMRARTVSSQYYQSICLMHPAGHYTRTQVRLEFRHNRLPMGQEWEK